MASPSSFDRGLQFFFGLECTEQDLCFFLWQALYIFTSVSLEAPSTILEMTRRMSSGSSVSKSAPGWDSVDIIPMLVCDMSRTTTRLADSGTSTLFLFSVPTYHLPTSGFVPESGPIAPRQKNSDLPTYENAARRVLSSVLLHISNTAV